MLVPFLELMLWEVSVRLNPKMQIVAMKEFKSDTYIRLNTCLMRCELQTKLHKPAAVDLSLNVACHSDNLGGRRKRSLKDTGVKRPREERSVGAAGISSYVHAAARVLERSLSCRPLGVIPRRPHLLLSLHLLILTQSSSFETVTAFYDFAYYRNERSGAERRRGFREQV